MRTTVIGTITSHTYWWLQVYSAWDNKLVSKYVDAWERSNNSVRPDVRNATGRQRYPLKSVGVDSTWTSRNCTQKSWENTEALPNWINLEASFLNRKKAIRFLCEVFCRYKGKNSIIHCDRMRKCKSQILIGETNEKSKKEENKQYENDNLPIVDGDENLTSFFFVIQRNVYTYVHLAI